MNSVKNLLARNEMIEQMNILAGKSSKFLFIIDFRAENGFIIPQSQLDFNILQFETPDYKFVENNINKQVSLKFSWKTKPVSFQNYQDKFNFVLDEIRKGNSYLVNLTQPTPIDTDLSLKDIFFLSNAKYKLWFNDCFVVFSPETFVTIKDGKISSFPMKGTIDASIPDAEEIILADDKEKAEHATIVDLIRNDLSMIAGNVTVERYRYIDKIITNRSALLQVSSCITGKLSPDYKEKLGNIVFKMLPAGSISGAPKPKTLDIIHTAENYERGFYTGIFGWFDGENLDSAVMIRFIEKKDNNLIFKSGGGITSQSIAENEYNELIQKIYVPFR